MESYIQITLLNDFIFCPRSIYFYRLYEKYASQNYKEKEQKIGTMNHKNIDKQKYSTKKNILQGLSVYSEKYNLCGKIDIFDLDKGELIERKTKIKNIYDGYRYQIYAQYFCLKEMGYQVNKLFLHSLVDNKRYQLDLPKEKEIKEFEELLQKIRNFDLKTKFKISSEKCKKCIYAELCDFKT
jgi:CRISPR-associated protein Cas4